MSDAGLSEGERRKREAFALLEATRRRLVLRARRVMVEHARVYGTVTIDDVRAAVPVPEDVSTKVFGPVAGGLAAQGILVRTDYRKTGRPVGHARMVTVWAIADRLAAERWLLENPEVD